MAAILAMGKPVAFDASALDRLTRGYMTGRLRLAGLLGGVAVPVIAFLV